VVVSSIHSIHHLRPWLV